jgi:hypothetical protein
MRNRRHMQVRFISLLVLITTLCLSAWAQQQPSPNSNQQLQQRIEELEKQVQALKAQAAPASAPATVASASTTASGATAPTGTPAAAPAPPPDPPQVIETPVVNEVAKRLNLNIFADVGAQWYNASPTTFYFGSFDMFMTAHLSERISALGEVLFLPDINDNSVSVDVTRLLLRYHQSDYLTASIGRYNTWVGYYNTAFNKGEFLETATDRPFIYAYDDFGGILPMQDVGINLTGKIPSGRLGLNYVVEAGNGRAWGLNVEPAQNRQDENTSKAINGGLFVQPERFPGLQAGFSLRHDNLTIPGPAVHETIATAHVVYTDSNYEILNEAVLDRHTVVYGPAFNNTGGYTQFSRRFRDGLRPYVRYQFFNADNDDPVFVYAPVNDYAPANYTAFVSRLNGPSAGVRYDFTEHSAFKFQYDRFALRNLPSENGLTAQFAFTF